MAEFCPKSLFLIKDTLIQEKDNICKITGAKMVTYINIKYIKSSSEIIKYRQLS